MERAARELGLNGFIVNSHTNGEYLDQEKFWPILEAAEALDKPIYIHPRTPPDAMAPSTTSIRCRAGCGASIRRPGCTRCG
ncbi:MAG: amidohydrolase family protein [Sphingomonas sp.]